jgi:NADH dehydrogenase
MESKLFKLKRGSVVTVIGGSGFLGRYVVRELASRGAVIKVASRHAERSSDLRTSGAVGQIGFFNIDACDEKQLEKVIKGSDAVVNLLGIFSSKGKQSFANIHSKAPSDIARLCKKHKVKRLVHISALGIERAASSSKYAQSKLMGEKNTFEHFKNATILRPSVMFGAEDNFTNLFNWLAKISPIMPLIGGGKNKFQPVYVADVAKAIVAALDAEPDLVCGKTFEIGGPEVYSFKEIIAMILKVGRRKRIFMPIPIFWAKFKAFFLEFLPKPLLTRDQVELMKFDNAVFGKNGLEVLGIKPNHMATILPTYLT